MLSKNNLKELNRRLEPARQRFALKKLTIGVASVLIGFTIMGISESAKADDAVITQTPNMSTDASSAVTAKEASNGSSEELSANSVAENSFQSTTLSQKSFTSVNSQSNPTVLVATTSDNAASSATTVESPAHFTGYTSGMDNSNPVTGSFGDESGMKQTTNINYIMRSYGGTSSDNNVTFTGNSQFIIYIPAGFTASNVTLTQNNNPLDTNTYLQSLGKVGPNEEETFLVSLPYTPGYSGPVTLSATLNVDSSYPAGVYTATTNSLMRVVNTGSFTTAGGTENLTLGTTTYSVLKAGTEWTNSNYIYVIGNPQATDVNFTGSTTWADGNSNSFTAGQTSDLTVTIQNNSSSTVINDRYYAGSADYLITIPQGFTGTLTNQSTATYPDGTCVTYTNLGNVGPNGEQVWKVHTTVQPRWSLPLSIKVSLTANANMGQQVFTTSTANILKAINNGKYNNSSTGTYTLSDGTSYEVVNAYFNAQNYYYGFNNVSTAVDFTGTTTWSGGSSNSYQAGTTTTLNVIIQNNAPNPSIQNQGYYQGTADYLVFIPRGFSGTLTNTSTNIYPSSMVTIDDLGTVGPNGEQVFKVHTIVRPGFGWPLNLQANLTALAGYDGQAFRSNSSDIVKAINTDNYLNTSTGTVTLSNGTTYTVVNTSYQAQNYYYGFNAAISTNFDGTVEWNPGTIPYGHQSGDATSTIITYTIKSGIEGVSDSGDATGYKNESRYLVYIPAGFETDQLTFGGTYSYASQVTAQNLGYVGTNGEQVWQVTAPTRPSDGYPLTVTANLKLTDHMVKDEFGANEPYGGAYQTSTNQLIKAINDVIEGKQNFSNQSNQFKIGDTVYDLADTSSSSQIFNYVIDAGTVLIDKSTYTVGSITGAAINADGNTWLTGHETLTIKGLEFGVGQIKHAGAYLDVYWGIPYKDGNELKRQEYDLDLSQTIGVILSTQSSTKVIGHVYNMGDHYRLVFNQEAVDENSDGKLTASEFELNWATTNKGQENNFGATATVNYKTLIYTYTSDVSKDGVTSQDYVVANDVLIGSLADNNNSAQYTSGMKVIQQYVYAGELYRNTQKYGFTSSSPSRFWYDGNVVGYDTDEWKQSFNYFPNVIKSGDTFSIDVSLPADITDNFNVTWMTADEVKQAILDNISTSETSTLSTQVTDGTLTGATAESAYLVDTKSTNGDKPADATADNISVEIVTDPNNPNHRIYKITTKDTWAMNGKGMVLFTVAAKTDKLGKIDLPAGVGSYEEDVADEVKNNANYTGANMANKTLLDALENTAHPVITLTGSSNGTIRLITLWSTNVQRVHTAIPANTIKVTKAMGYNYGGGKSIYTWQNSSDLSKLTDGQTYSLLQLPNSMLISQIYYDNGTENAAPKQLPTDVTYTWNGTAVDISKVGWQSTKPTTGYSITLTFSDASILTFDVDVLVLSSPVQLQVDIPQGYPLTNNSGPLLLANYGRGAGYVNSLKWIKAPQIVNLGRTRGVATLGFETTDYELDANGNIKRDSDGKAIVKEHPAFSPTVLAKINNYRKNMNDMFIVKTDGSWRPEVIQGTNSTAVAKVAKASGQVEELSLYSNANGKLQTTYALNSEGQLADPDGTNLITPAMTSLKLRSGGNLTEEQLNSLVNTSLLQTYGMSFMVLPGTLSFDSTTGKATGDVTVKVGTGNNNVSLTLPVDVPYEIVPTKDDDSSDKPTDPVTPITPPTPNDEDHSKVNPDPIPDQPTIPTDDSTSESQTPEQPTLPDEDSSSTEEDNQEATSGDSTVTAPSSEADAEKISPVLPTMNEERQAISLIDTNSEASGETVPFARNVTVNEMFSRSVQLSSEKDYHLRASTLPQTGNQKNGLAIAGLALLALIGVKPLEKRKY